MSEANLPGAPNLRRLAFAIVAVDVVGIAFALWLQYGAGASPRFVPDYGGDGPGIVFGFAQFVSLGLGVLIATRLPRHPVGWLLIISASAFLLDEPVTYFVIYAIHVSRPPLPGADFLGLVESFLWIPGVVPIALFLPLLFPTGRMLSPRWRAVVWLGMVGSACGIIGGVLGTNVDRSSLIGGVRPVVRLPQLFAVGDFLIYGFVLLPVAVIAALVSLALRYRAAASRERHQIKWLLFATAVYGFASLAGIVLKQAFSIEVPGLQTAAVLGLLMVPLAAAVAVLQYRLYDIDIVINRALVYGALAVFITAVYVGIVVGLGTLVGSGGKPNLLLSIVATAVVAVAFQPVRERLQKLANRLVYGRRATPYEVLSEFSQRVAESYAGEQVLDRMAQVLAEGTGAQEAAVWLRSGLSLRRAATWPVSANGHDRAPLELFGQLLPDIPGSDQAVAVRHQGQLLGALTVQKRTGESLTPIEEKLLDDLAHQAGLVLKNVGLTADLQARLEDLRASRQRLVAAQDDERRRLERNLHDGAQQHLVALKVKLGLAERLLAQDPARAKAAISELKGDADEALETLRDLARGIYPPLLAERGLAAALESQARKATIPVRVQADGLRRYPQEAEAAVYFCCLEALQNVQKYAGAESAAIILADAEGELRFEVQDDGAGFDPATTPRGSGLQNIEDRLNALGGTLAVSSRPGHGASVAGMIPVGQGVPVLEAVAATT